MQKNVGCINPKINQGIVTAKSHPVIVHWRHAVPRQHHVYQAFHIDILHPDLRNQKTLPISLLPNDGSCNLLLHHILFH